MGTAENNGPRPTSDGAAEKFDSLLRRVEEMPEIDDRPEDEILGYDQHGTCL
jgi:hypothetical protein